MLPGRDVERDRRRGVEVVAGPLVAHPRAAVAGAPVREVGLRIVVAGHPDRARRRSSTDRPSATSRCPARRAPAPCRSATAPCRSPVVRRDEAADAELAARRADHHLAVGDERRQRHVVARACCRRPWSVQTSLPVFASSATSTRLAGGEEHLVAVERDAAAGVGCSDDDVRRRAAAGSATAACRSSRRCAITWLPGVDDEHHAVVDDRRRLVAVARRRSANDPHRLQPRDVRRRDLVERAVAPAVVGAADHQPVAVGRA